MFGDALRGLVTFCFLVLMGYGQEIDKSKLNIILISETAQEYVIPWIENLLNSIGSNQEFNIKQITLEGGDEDYDLFCSSLTEGAALVIDFSWSGSDVVKSTSMDMNIPYIQVDVSISPWLLMLDAYLDHRNSTDVVLIYDTKKYVDESLFFWIDTTRLRLVMSDSLDKATSKKISQIRPIPNNIAVLASTTNMKKIFETAVNEQLVKLPDRWNLVFLDFHSKNFNKNVINKQPISLLALDVEVCCDLFKKPYPCTCPENFNLQEQFLNMAMSEILAIMKNVAKEGVDFPEKIECKSSKFDNETVQKIHEALEDALKVHKYIYKENSALRMRVNGTIEKGNENGTEVIATFSSNNITTVELKSVEPIRPFYRIGITYAMPWSYKEEDPETGQLRWTGYCAEFAEKLAEVMDFDFEFVEPKNGTFGKKVDGVWNGIIGDLSRGDTDLAVSAIIMTADREEVVDFVAPYFEQTGITIVMRKPVRKTSLFKFMTVLKLEVWLSIVAALIITGFMVWILDKYSPYSARNNKKAYPYPCREFTLKESFWFALTSFTPQGGGEAPKALSGRTLVAAYWLFVVLMLATFTANLAAFLTVERMQAPVQSLEQLARQSRINYTVVEESQTHQYFINMKFAEDTLYRMWKELTLNASTDDTRYRVWDYPIREQYGHILLAINDSNPVASAEEGFKIVDERLDADFAFIHDSSEIKYEISRNCNFTEVGDVFAEKPYAVAVQQGSHLQDELSKAILDLQKDRFFEQLQAKYWNQSAKGTCPSSDDNEGITLESLGGVFIATLFGLALAMLTLVGEVFYYRRKAKKEKLGEQGNKGKNLPGNVPALMPIKTIQLSENYPITIGTTFKPVTYKGNLKEDRDDVMINHVSLYPRARNRITQVNN